MDTSRDLFFSCTNYPGLLRLAPWRILFWDYILQFRSDGELVVSCGFFE